MEKIFSSVYISGNSFLVGIPQNTVERRIKDIPILGSLETTQVMWVPCGFATPIFIESIHLKESIPIKGPVHLKEFVPIKEFVHFKGSVRLSAFHSRQDSVYQVFDCQAILIVSRCHRRFIISLANWIRLLQDLSLSTVKVEHVEQCQGRYLTTPWYLMTH